MSSLTERLEAHARLHDAFYPPNEEQTEWAADLREAIEAVRERDELARQRGELAARVIELDKLVADLRSGFEDISNIAGLYISAIELVMPVNVASDSSTGAKTE